MRQKQTPTASVDSDEISGRPETPYAEDRDARPILESDSEPWGAQRYAEPMEAALPPTTSSDHADLSAADTDPWSNAQLPAKKKRLSLPWWCSIIAWILLWITVAVCLAFVTFYGIMFQDEKCKKWITSMLISFLSSILFTQPVKVLLLALFFALVFKKTDDEEEEEELDDEEDPALGPDEIWLHSATLDGN